MVYSVHYIYICMHAYACTCIHVHMYTLPIVIPVYDRNIIIRNVINTCKLLYTQQKGRSHLGSDAIVRLKTHDRSFLGPQNPYFFNLNTLNTLRDLKPPKMGHCWGHLPVALQNKAKNQKSATMASSCRILYVYWYVYRYFRPWLYIGL